MFKPQQLVKGDTIGIISPCSKLTKELITDATENLKEKGFVIKFSKNAFNNSFGYAASPQERADDFNQMILDPEVKMLFFGGGSVGNEILPLIDYEAIKKNPKIICSFSDSTTILNAITSKTGLVTYNGQTPRTFSVKNEYNEACFDRAFMQSGIYQYVPYSDWIVIREGECEGTLVGGYLENLALMIDSNYLNYDLNDDYIFFVEDHIDYNLPSNISRYFSHIEQNGFMNRVKALMFGHYSSNLEEPIIDGILTRIAEKYKIPVVKCDDFGHGVNNAILPNGIKARLNTNSKSIRFFESLVDSKQN